jgi:hypothetical protein
MADLYARVFYNRSLINNNDDRFVCNCTIAGTFGRYCEYQLTHQAKTFGEAIKAQFQQKEYGDSWNTQRYGKILCYETLPCPSSPLCLDWREICDGIQRCSNGIDEENCDKLEFNECEDDEFRCTNGMCISEEFWLDGKYNVGSSKNFLLHILFSQVILIAWIGAMNIILVLKNPVRFSRTQRNAMNIYVSAGGTRAVMENVFHGGLEWHFNDSCKQRMTVSTSAI